jgi:8-oxo-dGTP diphosphatase
MLKKLNNKDIILEYRFCPMCGHPLIKRKLDGYVRNMCEHCNFVHYLNPTPAAAVLCTQNDQILLVRRKYEPKSGDWSLPAGFVEYTEAPDAAAVRETREETGLDVQVTKLFGVYGSCDDPRTRVVLVVYTARIIGGTLRAGDDASEVMFFPKERLPENIAFSSHRHVLKRFISDNNS